jgi:hypothetical protein
MDTFARIWPFYLWMMPFGRIFDPETSMYFAVFANYSIWTWLVAWALRDFVIQQPPPHTWCENALFANPPIDIFLLFQYDAMRVLHHLAFGIRASFKSIFFMVLTEVWIVATVLIMENYTWLQVLIGALMGVGFALFCFHQIYFFWRPRFAYLAETYSMAWARAYDGVFHTPENSRNVPLHHGIEKWKMI